MRSHFVSILAAALTAIAVPSQQQQPDPTLATLSRSAEQRLQQSSAELDAIREQVANEKLPLARELTELEEKLARLRTEHDGLRRLADEEHLELAAVKSEIKARQDEQSYCAGLLDEYARAFESKVDQCELQYCGTAIKAAKMVTENSALSIDAKFAQQVALVRVSLVRLTDALGGMRFRGEAVDLQGTVAPGQFTLVGPVAMFRADNGEAGLVVPQTGSTLPLLRPLEGEIQAGIAPLVQGGAGVMPLDPTRGGALKALVQKFNLIHVFEKGGPIMWPLLVLSVLALAVVLERLGFLGVERRRRDHRALGSFFTKVEQGDLDGAIGIGKATKYFVVRALGYALAHREQSLPNALVYAQAQELKRFKRGIAILDTVITLAPLLGLLGTVTGMMGSFALIGGELSAPGAITGGIAEALIATAFGLGIAITALIPFNFLNARQDEASHEIESAATQLELLVQKHAPAAAAVVA